jgi:hypothetical protein
MEQREQYAKHIHGFSRRKVFSTPQNGGSIQVDGVNSEGCSRANQLVCLFIWRWRIEPWAHQLGADEFILPFLRRRNRGESHLHQNLEPSSNPLGRFRIIFTLPDVGKISNARCANLKVFCIRPPLVIGLSALRSLISVSWKEKQFHECID